MPKGKCIFKKALLENNKPKSWLKPGTTVYSVYASVSLMLHRNVSLQSEVMNVESAKKSMAPPFFGTLQYILMQVVPQLLVLVRS